MTTFRNRLNKGLSALTKRTEEYITQCIKSTLNDWSLGSIKESNEDIIPKGPDSARAKEKGGVTVLVVKNPAHAEEFLRLSQRQLHVSLNREKQDFVTAVRKMAEEARGKRFQALKDEIARLDPNIQPELREEIIEDLNNSSVDVRQVAFHQIKNRVRVISLIDRYRFSYQFRLGQLKRGIMQVQPSALLRRNLRSRSYRKRTTTVLL